ncbi:7-carboxy-7-deazaguanine synthase [Vreelandella sp. EE22]
MYHVKEAFYTLQGEGAQAGRASVFCRFTGCNLWSGREVDRASARCTFCDTDFLGTDGAGGGRFQSATDLAEHISHLWPEACQRAVPYVVFTGGEPLLQLDATLIEAVKAKGFEIGVETNGTVDVPEGIDWLCVSPKGDNSLKALTGDELKLVYPQPGVTPARFETLAFRHFFLQPMDQGPLADNQALIKATTAYCMANPQWRLSLQTHKIAGFE